MVSDINFAMEAWTSRKPDGVAHRNVGGVITPVMAAEVTDQFR
jgi:hypothetical protein